MSLKRQDEIEQLLKEIADVKKPQKETSKTFWIILIVMSLNIFAIYSIKEVGEGLNSLTRAAMNNSAEFKAIATKINADENEKIDFLKLQKNLEVWKETACIQCHNTQELALPINKITITEAISIVRNGNERTRAGGMPTYNNRNTRGKESITDSELQTRMQHLYTKDFLSAVNEKKKLK